MATPSSPDQSDFLECYRGRQSAIHHAAYMRMGKVLLALHLCKQAGIPLEGQDIFDYGFGAGTFFRYCPRNSRLYGVEIDPHNVSAVREMLEGRNYKALDLQPIDLERWAEHPLLARQYDVILCSHVLEHLPDPISFLKTLRRCLSPSGVFIALVPINERKLDPHHVQAVDRAKAESWGKAADLQLSNYIEADPWFYWIQPVLSADSKFGRFVAQGASLCVGLLATLLGPTLWTHVSRIFGALTASRPTQAGFILSLPRENQIGSATGTSAA